MLKGREIERERRLLSPTHSRDNTHVTHLTSLAVAIAWIMHIDFLSLVPAVWASRETPLPKVVYMVYSFISLLSLASSWLILISLLLSRGRKGEWCCEEKQEPNHRAAARGLSCGSCYSLSLCLSHSLHSPHERNDDPLIILEIHVRMARTAKYSSLKLRNFGW